MTLRKLVCKFCQKTIRKDFVPIQCQTCLAHFHKKCAKILNDQAIASNNFYCKCNCYEHKNSHVSHNSGKEKIVSSKCEKYFNTEKLNSIFADDSNSENKEHDNLIDPNSHHSQEQYLEIQSTKSLIFNKKICNSFLIICVNIRSLSNPLNFCKLESFVYNLNPKPDIIAVTETWIQNNSPGPYCYLENYNFISNSRKIAKGGGVGLYIKNCYKFNLIDKLTIMNEKIFESIFIKIQLHNENLFSGNIYRSPSNDSHLNKNFMNNLYNCIHNSNESLNKCFITGDFNYNLSNQDNEHVCNFIEMILEGHYFPVINKPTHITDTSATVLDHIWTNLHHQHIKSGVILNLLSDHLPVYMCFNLNKQNLYRPQQKRSFTPQNITKFNEMLENIDINAILNETNTNLAFKLLMDIGQ